MAAQDLSISITAIDKTTAAFRAVQTGLGNIGGTAANVTSKIGAVTAALTALGGAASIRNVIAVADSLDQLSARSGIAVQTLSSLANTARFTGVSQEELAGALVRLNKAIAEAASGSKEQIEVFQNLGVSFKNADGSIRPVVDVLGDVANAFSGAENNAIKTQYAMALFGKSGSNLIEFLDRGKTGIQDVSATIDEDFAKAAGTFNDNLDTMSLRVQGFLGQKLGPFLQFINRELQRVNDIDAEMKRSASGKISTQADVRRIDNALIASTQPKTSFKPIKTGTSGPSDAEKEATRLLEETRRAYQSVADEIIKLTEGEDALKVAQFSRLGVTDQQVAQYKEYLDVIKNLNKQEAEKLERDKEQEKLDDLDTKRAKDLAEARRKIFEDTRTPLENYIEQIQRLQNLGLDQDTFSRAVSLANDEFTRLNEKGKDTFASLEAAARGWGDQFTNTMASAVMSGKISFKDLANSVISDLLRMMIYQNITKPIFASLGFSLDGARAMGGPVTSGKSYLVGENGPEIFTPGSSGGITPNGAIGGGVSVNIINNSGASASAKESVDSRGNRRIDVIVGDLVAKEISRIGSNANQAIRTTFQTSPALAGR